MENLPSITNDISDFAPTIYNYTSRSLILYFQGSAHAAVLYHFGGIINRVNYQGLYMALRSWLIKLFYPKD